MIKGPGTTSLKFWKYTFFVALLGCLFMFIAPFTNVSDNLYLTAYSLISVATWFGIFIMLFRMIKSYEKTGRYAAIGFVVCIIVPILALVIGVLLALGTARPIATSAMKKLESLRIK
jgi:hypothetical protein